MKLLFYFNTSSDAVPDLTQQKHLAISMLRVERKMMMNAPCDFVLNSFVKETLIVRKTAHTSEKQ